MLLHTLKTVGTVLVGYSALALTTTTYGSLVFYTGFNEGVGHPSGTYLGSQTTGVKANTVDYSNQVNPFANGGYSVYIPAINPAYNNAVTFTTPTSLNDVSFTSGTIAAWINPESFPVSTGNRIFTTRETGGSSDAFDFYIWNPNHATNGGRLELHAGNGSGPATYTTTQAVFTNDSVNKWHFVAVTWDGNADRIDFYIGDSTGVLTHIETLTGININPQHHASDIRIGTGQGAGAYFKGLIDEFYLYNHALTMSELQAIMTKAVPEPASVTLLCLGGLLLTRRRSA